MWRLLFNHFSSCMLWYRFPRVLAAIYSKWFPAIYRVIYLYTLICMYLNILLNALRYISKPYISTFISMCILQYTNIIKAVSIKSIHQFLEAHFNVPTTERMICQHNYKYDTRFLLSCTMHTKLICLYVCIHWTRIKLRF